MKSLASRLQALEARVAAMHSVNAAEWMSLAARYVLDSPTLAPFLNRMDGPLQTDEAMEALRRESPELWEDPARVAAVREMVETMQHLHREYQGESSETH